MTDHPLETWHRLVRTQDPSGLNALLAEDVVYEWQAKGARLAKLLDYARLRPLASAALQQQLIAFSKG